MVAKLTHSLWPDVKKLAPIFNIQTKSDLLVAVKCMETGVFGAYANILINAKDFNGNDDKVISFFASLKDNKLLFFECFNFILG